MNIAIIPARGGSKRIPKKNIKEFAGKPIIAYSIDAAKESGLFDKVVVSTDSQEIADIAIDCGAEAPFMRPAHLADDFTPMADVAEHAIQWAIKQCEEPHYACLIAATAPMLTPADIRKGWEVLKGNDTDSVFSVTSFAFPIFRSLKITDSGKLAMFWPEHELTRSQDLPEAYHDATKFYWLRVKDFLVKPRLYTQNAMPVILPRYRAQDIDTPEDWEMVERMYTAFNSEQ